MASQWLKSGFKIVRRRAGARWWNGHPGTRPSVDVDVIFPVFCEPLVIDEEVDGKRFSVTVTTPAHLELYRERYELHFQMIPRLFWKNQRAGEVATWRRTFGRMLKEMNRAPSGANRERAYA
jgi:hypothetical protein